MVGVLECWSIGVMNWILGTPNIYGNTQLCNFNTPILHCSSTSCQYITLSGNFYNSWFLPQSQEENF